MDLQMIVLQGIPGSGKTTWAKEFLKGKTNWVRVSRDDLRNMRGDYWIPKQENLITNVERYMVGDALELGYNVIIDATNLHPTTILIWNNLAWTYKIKAEYKMFDIELEEAIKRDALRPNPVGAAVITNFYNKYIKNK